MASDWQHCIDQLSQINDDSNLSTETELERNSEVLSIFTSTKEFLIEKGALLYWLNDRNFCLGVDRSFILEISRDKSKKIDEILCHLPAFEQTENTALRESRFKIFKECAFILSMVLFTRSQDFCWSIDRKFSNRAYKAIMTLSKDNPAIINFLIFFSVSFSFDYLPFLKDFRKIFCRLRILAHFFIKKLQLACEEESCETCLGRRLALISIIRIFTYLFYEEVHTDPCTRPCDEIEKTLPLIRASMQLADIHVIDAVLEMFSHVVEWQFNREECDDLGELLWNFVSLIDKLMLDSDESISYAAFHVRLKYFETQNINAVPETHPCNFIWRFYASPVVAKNVTELMERSINKNKI